MRYQLIIVVVAFLILGAGCVSKAPTAEKQPASETESSESPTLGGTVRDPLGEREECLTHGDCPEGFLCVFDKVGASQCVEL